MSASERARLAATSCLFDTHGIASVTTPDFPAERLLVCFNPLVATERKRNALLDSTETAARVMAAAYAAGKFDRDELNRRARQRLASR